MPKPQWAAEAVVVGGTDPFRQVEAELRENNRDFEYGDENKLKDVQCAICIL